MCLSEEDAMNFKIQRITVCFLAIVMLIPASFPITSKAKTPPSNLAAPALSDPIPASSLYSSSANPPCLITLRYQQNNKNYSRNDILQDAMETEPINQWSRLFLVVRYVAKHVPDTTIEWIPPNKNKTVKEGKNGIVVINTQYTKPPRKMEFFIDYNQYKVNGQWLPIDKDNSQARPFIKNGRTLLPLRKVGESLDGEIQWNSSTLTAILTFKDPDCEEIKEISETYTFEKPIWKGQPGTPAPKLLRSRFGNPDEWKQIFVEDCHTFPQPGSPAIPSRGIEMEIPDGFELLSLTYKPLKSEVLKDYYSINCGQIPKNEFTKNWKATKPNPKIYEANADFPVELINNTTQQERNEKKILVSGLTPLRMNPIAKKVTFYSEIQVTMKIKRTPDPRRDNPKPPKKILSNRPNQQNPTINSLSAGYPLTGGPFKMVIIAPSALIGTVTGGQLNWADYADWKTTTMGIPTTTYPVSDIYSNYSGSNQQAQIKAFIRDAKSIWGIEYVLLGGDSDTIPSHTIDSSVPTNPITTGTMPSDTYYACLDQGGEWSGTTDYVYSMDLTADVYVGRVPVRSLTELQNFFTKQYIVEPKVRDQSFFGTTLLASGLMDSQNWGESYSEDLVSTIPGFSSMTKTKLYQNSSSYSGSLNLPNSDSTVFQQRINTSQPDIVVPTFHGNYNVYGAIQNFGCSSCSFYDSFVSNDVGGLNNSSKPFLVNTTACLTNCFSPVSGNDLINGFPGTINQPDVLSEVFVRSNTSGAFAYIGGAHYGWYSTDQYGILVIEDSASYQYQKEFFLRFLPTTSLSLGKAFHQSKEEFQPYMSYDDVQWVYHSLNLLGDPSTGEPGTPATTCCSYLIMEPTSDPEVCAGLVGTYTFQIKNTCTGVGENRSYTITKPIGSPITSITGSPTAMVAPGATTTDITITFTMPPCTVNDIVPIYFTVTPQTGGPALPPCGPISESFTVTCKDCSTCCLLQLTVTQATVPLCAGETGTYKFKIQNLCTVPMTYTFNQPGSLLSFTPPSITTPVQPNLFSPEITVSFTMPPCTVGGSINFPFTITPAGPPGLPPCDPEDKSFTVTCKECVTPCCCTFEYIPITTVTPEICKGATGQFKFRIKNTCPIPMNYSFILPMTTNITSFTPASISTPLPPGTVSPDITITFTMPNTCTPGNVWFPFTIKPIDPSGSFTCSPQIFTFKAICKELPCLIKKLLFCPPNVHKNSFKPSRSLFDFLFYISRINHIFFEKERIIQD